MQSRTDTWENLTSKRREAAKSYALNSSNTTIAHVHAHEVSVPGSLTETLVYITMSTYDCEFVLLENRGRGQFAKDVEVVEELRVRTDFPILHALLEHHYDAVTAKHILVGYLIDLYATTYSINLTKAIEYAQKYPNNPVQVTTLAVAFRGIVPREDQLYLETPLILKKTNNSIISINLRGEVLLLDITQSRSWIRTDDLTYQRESLGKVALAAAHNRTPCKKYESVVVVATHNGRTPYIFVNCTSTTDFENQKRAQDKYEWTEDCLEVTFCAVDPLTSLVCVSTVAQMVEIYQIGEGKDTRGLFYYLRKKFGFFIQNNLHFTPLQLDGNIEHIHTAKGLLLITSCREQITYDLTEQAIRRRVKGNNIVMLKWGEIMERTGNVTSVFMAKGYNHMNSQQSKMGKPNVHFKLLELKDYK